MRTIFFITALCFFLTNGFSQNYLGYSKQFILKALKSQRKDMKGPIIIKAANDNFISYIAKDGRRVVYYHFKMMTVTSDVGRKSQEELCVKYVSKNKCRGYTDCPEMDEVVKSLDSHFTKVSDLIWVDYSKTTPHEWVIVRDEDYFETHVTELKK